MLTLNGDLERAAADLTIGDEPLGADRRVDQKAVLLPAEWARNRVIVAHAD